MKSKRHVTFYGAVGRSPYGERGLKCMRGHQGEERFQSLSLRRAWIEIPSGCSAIMSARSLSLRRAWIEIDCKRFPPAHVWSLSLRRAWIEILTMASMLSPSRSRSPYGERGLKCDGSASLSENWRSLSLRRAWIEIVGFIGNCWELRVALLTESVD